MKNVHLKFLKIAFFFSVHREYFIRNAAFIIQDQQYQQVTNLTFRNNSLVALDILNILLEMQYYVYLRHSKSSGIILNNKAR